MERIFFVVASALLSMPCVAQTAPATLFQGAARLAPDQLAGVTGRADTALVIRADNSATVSRNVINGESVTGGISFGTDALGNLSGLSVLSANTGNNVAINSSLNLNVSIHP